ncbi:diguanylate cyclase [Alteromonas sediminis]|uniref:diguanylate cyclase n=1 Tax=Alteromonas sediminis TaxID=2259342 RepID=A0A3N5Y566_9ALTE|nr:diguanylate cyclase [Alteromonas sediminis]RPJ65359.1 diguanylate cyclase [Alteromonas sediminis]
MQHQVLIVESNTQLARLLHKQVIQAGLEPLMADSMYAAKKRFSDSLPESLLCALVGYAHPDAECAEAIAFTTGVAVPTIAISEKMDGAIHKHVMHYDIVDYVGLENAQTIDYLYRLLLRLNKNKRIGVLVLSEIRRTRQECKNWLQRHSFRLYEAITPDQAHALLLANNDIQIVMVDTNYEDTCSRFIADLRKVYTKDDLAIVGMSHKPSNFVAAHFIKCGATDFFTLPFNHEEFLCRVMQMLESIEHVALIRKTANTDYLTGLPNRRHFFFSVNKRQPAHISTQALAIIDLDHFKHINDTYGHDAGDAVLKNVARLLATEFEHADIARFGGEEFCVYLPDIAVDDAIATMQSLCQKVAALHIDFNNTVLRVTTSIGLTVAYNSNIEAMLSKADAMLYEAKNGGRNQVRYNAEC